MSRQQPQEQHIYDTTTKSSCCRLLARRRVVVDPLQQRVAVTYTSTDVEI